MKVRNWPLVMISIYIFIITGCSIGLENEEQKNRSAKILVIMNMKILR